MANVITCIRIICGIALIFCPVFSKCFYLCYIVGGASDVLDGAAARYLGKETKLGAQLDTAADCVFFGIVLIKLLATIYIPLWLTVWIVVIAFIKCANTACGLIRYKRIVPVHTLSNKICGILLFAIPLCIGSFPWQPVTILIIATCALATFAAIQEGRYIRTGKEIP